MKINATLCVLFAGAFIGYAIHNHIQLRNTNIQLATALERTSALEEEINNNAKTEEVKVFAKNFNKLLEEKEYTNKRFAEKDVISESSISNYRRGKTMPDKERVEPNTMKRRMVLLWKLLYDQTDEDHHGPPRQYAGQ